MCERLGWEGAGIWGRDDGDGGPEGVEMGGIFEGFGMNEEGRRSLGRGEAKRLPSTGFLELYVYVFVNAPCLFIPFPVTGARHSILALDQTTCLVRFSVYIV